MPPIVLIYRFSGFQVFGWPDDYNLMIFIDFNGFDEPTVGFYNFYEFQRFGWPDGCILIKQYGCLGFGWPDGWILIFYNF